MYAFTLERPATAGRRRQAGRRRRQAAGRRPDPAGLDEAAPVGARTAGRPRRHQGTGRHPQGRQRAASSARWRATATWPTTPTCKAAFPALADLAGHIGDRQVRAHGHPRRLGRQQRPGGLLPGGGAGRWAPPCVTDQREIAADDFFQGLFTTALEDGELITAVRFPVPKRAAYEKLRQKASHFPLVGVFVAQTDSGVRVAVTGARQRRVPPRGAGGGAEQELHARGGGRREDRRRATSTATCMPSAAYRANLISVLTQRAVAKALG